VIRHSVLEWGYLAVRDDAGADAVTRAQADALMAVARASKIGGDDGEAVLVNGHRRLRAQQVVGVVAAPGVSLEILPKIDGLTSDGIRRNLVRMLARVLDLKVASGSMADLGWQRHDLLEILIKLFCDQLFAAVHQGLPRRYIGHEDDLPKLRGRLDVRRQFTVLAASPQKLACRFEELSADIALNQIMKAAVTRLFSISRASENRRRLAELCLAFDDVSSVPVAELAWDRVILDRTNSAWGSLLNLAKLLLGERFQTTSSGDVRGFSLLFEMNTLFEEFIGRSLQAALAGSDLKVRLQGPQSYALVGDNEVRRFATRPDIVVSRDGEPVLIIDTKWKRLKGAIDDPKRGVGQADVYQMMAYAQVYRCERLMLLYPHHDELGELEGVHNSHRIVGTADARLCVASIDLADPTAVGRKLLELVGAQCDLLAMAQSTVGEARSCSIFSEAEVARDGPPTRQGA
jgi:5-methylcytosine-specific restriction enzyme subunit McrC